MMMDTTGGELGAQRIQRERERLFRQKLADLLEGWRAGDVQAHQPRLSNLWHDAYLVTIAGIQSYLTRYTTPAALMAAYDSPEDGRRIAAIVEQTRTLHGISLNVGICEDAGYHARFQQLVGLHVQPVDRSAP